MSVSHPSGRGRLDVLTVVIDLFSRPVVGLAVVHRLHRRLAIAALQTLLGMPRPLKGLIHQSDRGSECGVVN
jgi:transposase InsO family protein